MIVSEQVLDNDSWKQIRPLGMRCNLISRETMPGEKFENILIQLTHDYAEKQCALELVIPVFNGNVISWRNSKKALMSVGRILVDSDFEISIGTREKEERMDLHITSPAQTAVRKISEQITQALRNWFYDIDSDFDNKMVQVAIDKWFSNGEEWRVLKYSEIALEDQQNGLVIINDVNSISHTERMVNKIFSPKLWNILDLNSTSFGDRANESFRFVSGVTMEDGKVKPSESKVPVCEILNKHAIGLGMNPRRAYLLRNTFEQVIDLINPEEPLVSPYQPGETNMLHGLNLMTAIMHLEHYTHEDGIAISESAAKKMVASRIVTQLVESDLPVKSLVEIGSPVSTDTPIAMDGENFVLSNKLHMPGIVEEVVHSNGKRFGVDTNRIWFKMRSFYNLENGDKLSNRHGGKGVVTVIPDELMPWDPDTGEKIEVCIARNLLPIDAL